MQCLESYLTVENVCKVITQAHDCIMADGSNDTVEEEDHLVQTMWTVINMCLEFAIGHNTDDILSSDSFLELSQDVMIVVVSAKVSCASLTVCVWNQRLYIAAINLLLPTTLWMHSF